MEKQRAQNNQLCVALKHERAAKDNLQKELQIEASRCEALLAQEKGQLSELQKSLEAEKSRSLELSEALQHERLLTEQLSRHAQEACARQDAHAQHALLRKLKAEKARTLELEAMLEKVQKQAAHTRQQLESQAQERCVELRKEKEVSGNLRSTVDAMQTHTQELGCCLQREREKSACLQAELEQLSTRVKEQEGHKDAKRLEKRSSRADVDKKKWQRDKEKLVRAILQQTLLCTRPEGLAAMTVHTRLFPAFLPILSVLTPHCGSLQLFIRLSSYKCDCSVPSTAWLFGLPANLCEFQNGLFHSF